MEGKKKERIKMEEEKKRKGKIFHFPSWDPPLGGNLEVRTRRPTGLLRHCLGEPWSFPVSHYT